MDAVLKTAVIERLPWVRIPPLPPNYRQFNLACRLPPATLVSPSMKSLLQSPLWLVLLSLLFVHTSPLFAQAATTAPKIKKIPFHGKIVAMDAGAGTITLNGKTARMLHITSSHYGDRRERQSHDIVGRDGG